MRAWSVGATVNLIGGWLLWLAWYLLVTHAGDGWTPAERHLWPWWVAGWSACHVLAGGSAGLVLHRVLAELEAGQHRFWRSALTGLTTGLWVGTLLGLVVFGVLALVHGRGDGLDPLRALVNGVRLGIETGLYSSLTGAIVCPSQPPPPKA